MTDCPFCFDNWDKLDIVERWLSGAVAVLRPLDPVTEGHVLVIHRDHDENVAFDNNAARRASVLMAVAANYVGAKGLQANIITSVGPDATQTVMHTHLHIVPRRSGDGLPLPWTPQHERKAAALASSEGL